MVAKLKEKISSAENILIFQRKLLRIVVLTSHERAVHLAAEAGRKREEPLVMFAQEVLVHARLVVEALQMRFRDKLDEVFPSRLVFREKHEMKVFFRCILAESVARRDIRLNTKDGFHARLLRLLVEFNGAVEHAMVGERQRVHPELFCPGNKLVYLPQPVQK